MVLVSPESSAPTSTCTRFGGRKEENRKCFPSGRNQGARSLPPLVSGPGRVAAVAAPPEEEILTNPPRLLLGAKTIMPLALHEPPRGFGASASVTGGPPAASTFFSFPPAKNPT